LGFSQTQLSETKEETDQKVISLLKSVTLIPLQNIESLLSNDLDLQKNITSKPVGITKSKMGDQAVEISVSPPSNPPIDLPQLSPIQSPQPHITISNNLTPISTYTIISPNNLESSLIGSPEVTPIKKVRFNTQVTGL
jgi:hypothetical protein